MQTKNSVDGYEHKILVQLYFALFINLNAMPRPNSALVHSVYAHFRVLSSFKSWCIAADL